MKKNIKKLTLGILILALLYGLVWFINLKYVYDPFIKEVPKHESGLYFLYDEETNYSFNVKPPVFPSFTGNLGVSDDEGAGFIIWPGFFGKNYEYGARVKDGDSTYQVKLDKDMKLLSEDDEEIEEAYEKNKDLIKTMWDSAEKIWKKDF